MTDLSEFSALYIRRVAGELEKDWRERCRAAASTIAAFASRDLPAGKRFEVHSVAMKGGIEHAFVYAVHPRIDESPVTGLLDEPQAAAWPPRAPRERWLFHGRLEVPR